MNYMEAVFAVPEALYRAQVMQNTWGHLYPTRGSIYRGTIDVAVDCHNEYVVVDWDLRNANGEELDGSPIWHDHMNDFACDQCPINVKGREAGLYRFQITYRWFKNGKHKITIHGSPQRAVFPKRQRRGHAGKQS